MRGVIKNILMCVASVLMGIVFIEMILTEPTDDTGANVFGLVCGIVFVAFGVALFIIKVLPEVKMLKKKTKDKKVSKIIKKEIKSTLLPDFSSVGDENPFHVRLSSFRENYSKFFLKDGAKENAAIQNNVTQIFRNILELQRLRLKKKNVQREFSSERKCYGEKPVSISEEFDGKYKIQDVNEDIAAKSVYTKDGKKIFSRVSAETAHYTVINAKQVGKSKIICPNCGAETNRTNLLDGCDYCGTKFTVEDLGERISDFSLRKNIEVEYKKYAAFRNKIILWVVIAIGIVVFIPITYWSMQAALDSTDTGFFMAIAAMLFSSLFMTFAAEVFGLGFFFIAILPFIQAAASSTYIIKKFKAKVKKTQDSNCIDKIRRFDPLFSFKNFSSSVTNKLATIIYAENKNQGEAFYVGEKELDFARYKNVIEFDVLEMQPVEYKVEGGMQRLLVYAELELIKYNRNKCKPKLEKLMLSLVKSAKCKTQAICAPSVMTCKGCGVSRSLLDGKACPQCGREIDFSQYDWVIDKVQINSRGYFYKDRCL